MTLYPFTWQFSATPRDGKGGIALSGNFPNHVRFLDTTLRDEEQTPGVSLTPSKKLQIARKLNQLARARTAAEQG